MKGFLNDKAVTLQALFLGVFKKLKVGSEKTQAQFWAKNSRYWSQLEILSKKLKEIELTVALFYKGQGCFFFAKDISTTKFQDLLANVGNFFKEKQKKWNFETKTRGFCKKNSWRWPKNSTLWSQVTQLDSKKNAQTKSLHYEHTEHLKVSGLQSEN